ncbi:hypothetical protein ABFS82_09G090500 [Erythranthe guttata]|uniref:Protein FAR1-RELATED SEQUENCE n=1 Tax=Erythranthe guttata TaxID=4155 RepID=A0A022Q368_ERYGU|nr:PREDICTED: protein FAR1-RELATED SEQUENCE 6-like [Erythranthe guttata]EYU21668.1 hypothetical protein MIMGU_mgv1a026038mg [Erythranthe guttata]|eukprot:XP_012856675.1 PREDICTED: protein FAR1-RELATED SEQUENCE 6-like [Erythranthe guttata]
MDEFSLNTEPACDDEAEEFEIDGECAMTEYVGQTGNILRGENPLPPAVGMEFDSYDDVYYFYNCYAKQQGFGVRVSNTWYRKSKERYRAKFSCSSAGFKKKTEANRPRPETRTGCPAMIKFRLMDNHRWRIIEMELEHNHLTGPAGGSFCKSRRITDLGSKRPLSIDGSEEVCKIKLFRTLVIDEEDDGGETRINIDGGDDKLKLKQGDAREMLDFFTRMQLTSPGFFYVMDFNEKGCLRNVFWAETRCRAAYGYFGDVVFFDTKSLTENYEVPLVVFACINHHMQMVPLGCGLVSSQSVESFIWLFRAWITYMVGRAPQTIITGPCKALQSAVSDVFPRAFHCLSLTNIKEKIASEFDPAFTRVVYGSLRVDEFELAWEDMVKTHGLENHKWLQTLYEDRKRWVPLYLKEVFLAGLFPVKENERLSSPFEEYLSPQTSLKEFLCTYERALLEIEQRETLSDMESTNNSSCALKSRFSFELQLSKLYTNEIFKKFQDEIEGMYSCFSVREISTDSSSLTYYIVKEDILVEQNHRLTREFEVMYNTCDSEILCACGLFNFRGYLCRHALSVINETGLEETPPRYILARWRKDIGRDYIFNHGCNNNNNNGDDIDINNPVHRYDSLYKCVVKVVDEGRRSHDRYKFASRSLDEILNKVHVQENCPATSSM